MMPDYITPQLATKCPGCGAVIGYHDAENSIYYACQKCGTFFWHEDDNQPQTIKRFFANEVTVPAIPIGTKGTIDGREFTVVGFMNKTDTRHEAHWREYLLYNPDLKNYHTLAEYNGHWTLLWQVDLMGYKIFGTGENSEIRGYNPLRIYSHYNHYSYEILWAAGEFDWNITEDEGTHMEVDEFVRPPEIIVTEEDANKKDCFWGKFIDRSEIITGFGLTWSDLPPKFGPGVLEIPAFEQDAPPLRRFTLLMVALIILTPMIISFFKPSGTVFQGSYTSVHDTTAQYATNAIVTEPFELKWSGPVNVALQTGLDNNWMELTVALVNEQTGQEYEFSKVLEYWHGSAEGEAWSEGDYDGDANFSSVPAGRYHINIYAFHESPQPIGVSIVVEQNTVLYSNVILMLLLLLIYPMSINIKRSTRNARLYGE